MHVGNLGIIVPIIEICLAQFDYKSGPIYHMLQGKNKNVYCQFSTT
jgi:hypothetical protein